MAAINPTLRTILVNGLNRAYDLAQQAENAGSTVHVMNDFMNCAPRGKAPLVVPLISFVIDGKAV